MNRQSTLVHQRLEAVEDLSQLQGLSDETIVSCLRERFLSDTIYTRIGSAALVAVNPNKYVSSNADSVMHKYAGEYRAAQPDKAPQPPHIFQFANNAYYHMRRTTQDQSILLAGETGSGKSENRRLAIKSILELSVPTTGKKGSKLAHQVPAAEFVLESFGNARTLFNSNASRFGKYTELQFSDKGRLCGIKTLDYYLERNRVAGAPSGERNFHIFYYLVAGATQEERQHMHLTDKATFRYLGNRGVPAARQNVQDDDSQRFEHLKLALKNVGFSKRHVAQTCQLIAAILHLGNLDFTIDRSRDVDAAVVRNQDVLHLVAEFLGVLPAALETALSYKTKLVKKELCTVFLDPDGAADNRDDLAKTLYSLLFAWLNEHINERLCRDDFVTFIGLFDLPGPQNLTSRPNSLDQFCINFANERLVHFVQRKTFEAHVAEYSQEGISRFVPQVPYFDNTECIRLLQNQPGGLIHIMDDQSRRAPRKTDHTMAEAFSKRWGNHGSFRAGSMDRSGFPTFTVNHYNGPVTYSTDGFLAKNLDALNPDFVSLLRGRDGEATGSEGTGSINPFVRGLFSAKAIATQVHPRHDETIVAAQQPFKPMRTPSTRRKNTIKRSNSTTLGAIDEKNAGAADDDDEGGDKKSGGQPCVAGEFRQALDTLFETLDETHAWFVFCIAPNDSQLPNQLEGRAVKGQVRALGLPEIARRSTNVFEVGMTPREFCDRYREQIAQAGVVEGDTREQVEQSRTALGLDEADVVLGQYKVFLSQRAFHTLEDFLRARDTEEQRRNRMREAELEGGLGNSDPYAPYADPEAPNEPYTPHSADPYGAGFGASSSQALPLMDHASPFQRADMYGDYDGRGSADDFDARSRLTSARDGEETMSIATESYAPSRNMFNATAPGGGADKNALLEREALPGEVHEGETAEVLRESSARRRWVALCWLLTWWVPTPFLKWFGRMKRIDIQQAWREKLAINLLIWLACGCAIFVIAGLTLLICPTEHVFSTGELSSHGYNNGKADAYVAIRGEVFDLTQVAQTHLRIVPVVSTKTILQTYAGTDATDLFPVQVSALCNGVSGTVSPFVYLSFSNTSTDTNSQYHDFRVQSNDSRPDWYFESMTVMRWNNRVGFMGYTPSEIKNMAEGGKSVGVYNGILYDLSDYVSVGAAIAPPPGQSLPSDLGGDTQFMDSSLVDVFKFNSGKDITKDIDGLNLNSDVLHRQRVCLRNLFAIGKVDNRRSAQCQFAAYFLLALSIMMVSIILFKFLAAINFGSARAPEDHDKFVICQVPCYTEGESSLKKTIDSLAELKYDDKRKLIVVICDGMIVGSGNDKPTPRIVLDILGADASQDPEPLSFGSLGEGAKQHNMGKVYSGLYEVNGHVVPYLVVAKVGKPSERSRPGNRGKRDSQILLMRFFNRVHFNAPMTPLELEMYHQIKNVIGVNPTFYEYIFTVDADTTVEPLSLNRLVSAMTNDKRVIGVCGETGLANAKQTITTMMQVYEYFISHNLAKAFESLFGSVTCLPGCFTLYRLRTPDTHKPVLVSTQLVDDYAENRVDTLHMKNLLHLGEDRYLTTLLLKHFPLYKTQFVRDAHAFTVAPDDWKVLLSQRRRWINSTVHNLAELIFLDKLCGFCCFSMRFVVMIDLVSTIIQPVSVGYIVYIIYLAASGDTIQTVSIILIVAVYGIQMLVFVLRRKWDMIGWLVFYILAIPIMSLAIPLYSFWKMDDFSWGQTRIVLGEQGKKLIVHDEGKFDPRSIPLKSWNEYENELWDKESNHSIGSWVPPTKLKNDGYAQSATASLYGRETYYDPHPQQQRSFSPSPSMMGYGHPAAAYGQPPGYQSGRGTPTGGYAQNPFGAGAQSVYGGQSTYGGVVQPTPSRPATNYLGDVQIPMSGSPDAMQGGPSDGELEHGVRAILAEADLNTITKREIRRRLEERFGTNLDGRKAVINAAIDRGLLEHA